jgi:hypothetical protein
MAQLLDASHRNQIEKVEKFGRAIEAERLISATASSCNIGHLITILVEITGFNPCTSAATKLKEARLQAVPRLSELSLQLQLNEFSGRRFQHDFIRSI